MRNKILFRRQGIKRLFAKSFCGRLLTGLREFKKKNISEVKDIQIHYEYKRFEI